MKTALIIIPDGLDKVNGFLNYAHAFTRFLRDQCGYRCDVVAHHVGAGGMPAAFRRLYQRVYWPRGVSPHIDSLSDALRRQHLALMGRQDSPWVNHLFPAAFLASLAPYDLYVVHHIPSQWVRHFLPTGSRQLLFTHYYHSVLDGAIEGNTPAEIDERLKEEISPCQGFDLVTTTGPADKELFLRHRREAQVFEFPHCPPISRAPRLRTRGSQLLFNGFDNPSNRLAIDQFMREVYPLLRQQAPHVTLHIVGNLRAYVQAKGYDSQPGIVVHGYLPRLQPLLSRIDLVLALITHTEGVKTRIIEALAQGLPVITTPQGLTNTRLRPGQEVVVAAMGPAMAQAIQHTLASSALRARLRRSGYAYVRAHHSFSAPILRPLRQALLAPATAGLSSSAPSAPSAAHALPSVRAGLQLLVPWAVHHCRQAGYRRVAFFGAGTHTAYLLPLWQQLLGPQVVCVVVSTPSSVSHIHGVPVLPLSQLSASSVDAVIASSQTYEVEMAATLRKSHPQLPFVTLWKPL